MTTIPEKWKNQALYDLETAKAMLESGRWLYVLFCCQQAVEKTLKAVIAKKTKECPPRIHQLMRLAQVAKLEIGDENAVFLRELTSYYIQTRYPEEISEIASKTQPEKALQIFSKTEEFIQWLESKIQ